MYTEIELRILLANSYTSCRVLPATNTTNTEHPEICKFSKIFACGALIRVELIPMVILSRRAKDSLSINILPNDFYL